MPSIRSDFGRKDLYSNPSVEDSTEDKNSKSTSAHPNHRLLDTEKNEQLVKKAVKMK